jgi:hypothetical protein
VFDRCIIFVQRLLGGLAFQYFDFNDGRKRIERFSWFTTDSHASLPVLIHLTCTIGDINYKEYNKKQKSKMVRTVHSQGVNRSEKQGMI